MDYLFNSMVSGRMIKLDTIKVTRLNRQNIKSVEISKKQKHKIRMIHANMHKVVSYHNNYQ